MSRHISTTIRRCLFGVFVVGVAAASAQSFYGGMRGAVRDADGVVSNDELTLVNEETAVARISGTNGVGEYAFTDATTWHL